MRDCYTYMMTNKNNTVLYIGVTSNLVKRVSQHKLGVFEGFTKRYNLHKLVYYEVFPGIEYAIQCEKELKKISRKKKEALINAMNPDWMDLAEELNFG